MATITILEKPTTKKVRLEVNMDQWERLADALGFYNPSFLKTIKESIKESRAGKVRKIKSLADLNR